MTGAFQIRYLATAENDLVEIFDYIAKDRPAAAASLLESFDKTIGKLACNPDLGVVPKDDRLKGLGYRVLIIQGYLVFYVVKKRTIQIRRVLHGARRYEFLL